VEISPFKSRAKLLTCESCGARVVSVPIAEEVLGKVKVDWERFRRLARLCPACRRQATVLAMMSPGSTKQNEYD